MLRARELRLPRALLGALCLTGAMAWQSASSWAVSDNVRNACMNDYFAYCSKHDVDTPGLRRCMQSVASKLSKPCVNALVASGEVKVASADRRSGKSRKKPA